MIFELITAPERKAIPTPKNISPVNFIKKDFFDLMICNITYNKIAVTIPNKQNTFPMDNILTTKQHLLLSKHKTELQQANPIIQKSKPCVPFRHQKQ